jgi:hypothetical protein
MIEALHQKPDENDIEGMRLYLDNIWGVFNRTIIRVTRNKKKPAERKKIQARDLESARITNNFQLYATPAKKVWEILSVDTPMFIIESDATILAPLMFA